MLEFRAQGKLYNPGAVAARGQLETQVLQAADGVGRHVVRMVEGIEKVSGKANVQPFSDPEVFVGREVVIPRTWPVWTKPGFTPIQRPLFQVPIAATCQPPIT